MKDEVWVMQKSKYITSPLIPLFYYYIAMIMHPWRQDTVILFQNVLPACFLKDWVILSCISLCFHMPVPQSQAFCHTSFICPCQISLLIQCNGMVFFWIKANNSWLQIYSHETTKLRLFSACHYCSGILRRNASSLIQHINLHLYHRAKMT